jgi:hypothetical protein
VIARDETNRDRISEFKPRSWRLIDSNGEPVALGQLVTSINGESFKIGRPRSIKNSVWQVHGDFVSVGPPSKDHSPNGQYGLELFNFTWGSV